MEPAPSAFADPSAAAMARCSFLFMLGRRSVSEHTSRTTRLARCRRAGDQTRRRVAGLMRGLAPRRDLTRRAPGQIVVGPRGHAATALAHERAVAGVPLTRIRAQLPRPRRP